MVKDSILPISKNLPKPKLLLPVQLGSVELQFKSKIFHQNLVHHQEESISHQWLKKDWMSLEDYLRNLIKIDRDIWHKLKSHSYCKKHINKWVRFINQQNKMSNRIWEWLIRITMGKLHWKSFKILFWSRCKRQASKSIRMKYVDYFYTLCLQIFVKKFWLYLIKNW